MGRTGDPKGVVKALIYLVKDADYITGEVIRVDGGWHLA
jgi:NAD(P)-dependent dehydrogenase (short-subunit alcohol dehydrogenase family)